MGIGPELRLEMLDGSVEKELADEEEVADELVFDL